jgi:hypothetical protein
MGAAEGLHSSCCPPDPSCLLSVADAGPRLYEDEIRSVEGSDGGTTRRNRPGVTTPFPTADGSHLLDAVIASK